MKNDLHLMIDAAAFAADKHRFQRRKGAGRGAKAIPYINHPLEVALILANEGGVSDPITLAAALLHDTVEDTRTSPGELIERFGVEIAEVVMELTDDKSLPKFMRKELQVINAPHKSLRATLVKTADKICNLRDLVKSPPNWTTERKQDYLEWSKEVVGALPLKNQRLKNAFNRSASNAQQTFAKDVD